MEKIVNEWEGQGQEGRKRPKELKKIQKIAEDILEEYYEIEVNQLDS